MSTKTMKILTFVATVVLLISLGATTVFGLTPNQLTGATVNSTEATTFGRKIIGILQTVGTILAVVILVILGLKYMMGSAEEKADYKKTMIPYVIGAVCIFLAPTIAQAIYNMVQG